MLDCPCGGTRLPDRVCAHVVAVQLAFFLPDCIGEALRFMSPLPETEVLSSESSLTGDTTA